MAEIRCDLVTIGTGAAGLVAGTVAGGLGFKVCTVERDRIGGECTWTGCVPSKALLHAASVAWRLQHGPFGGVRAEVGEIDTSRVFEYVRRTREEIAAEGTVEKLRERGFEVVMGEPRLEPGGVVRTDDDVLIARRIILATGSSPSAPPIEGLGDAGYLTNQTLFELASVPRSMVIIGAGPIGVEMAQAFNRLGCDVTVLEQSAEILPRDDPELAGTLREILCAEGVEIVCGATATSFARGGGKRRVVADVDAEERAFEADELLLAVGRRANVDIPGLEDVGVEFSSKGVRVNRYLRTTNPHIWAAGDVTGAWQFSHLAEREATAAVRNALFPLAEAMDYSSAGWATFTEPELACCGMNEVEARDRGVRHRVYRFGFAGDDRSRVEEETEGQVKVVADPRSGAIHGAQILGPHAGELIQEFMIAKAHGIPVSELARDVHIYPTFSMAVQRAAQMWWQDYSERDTVRRWLGLYRRLTGWHGRGG